MKRFALSSLLFFCFVPLNSIFAWGNRGHAYVAEVAFKYLDAQTKKNVVYYLDGMSIEEAANWMDAIKSDDANNHMKRWHYINIEKGATEMPKNENVVSMINQTLSELDAKNNLTREEIKLRILYLFHLIGDLHQPLHVGYASDRGGNDIKLAFTNRGDSNLHSVWDSGIIESTNMMLTDILKMNTYTPEQLDEIKKINVFVWAGQSRSYLKNAYKINDTKINNFYVNENAKIIKSQLLNAGIRLAAVLEKYFGKVDDLISAPTTTLEQDQTHLDTKAVEGIVQHINLGKDGYTATLKTDTNEIYFITISSINLKDASQYKSVEIGQRIKISGNFWNMETENHITAREIQ